MNLCDSNIWLALVLSKHIHHAAANRWLDSLEEPAVALFCRATQQTLLRLLTNASVLAPYGNPPLKGSEAWATYEALLEDERIAYREGEPAGIEPLWKEHSARGTSSPKLWMDAYLAAFALAGRYTLVTTDGGFRQFRGLDLLVLGSS